MSRIHEALKKAQEERAAQLSDPRLEPADKQPASHQVVAIAPASEIAASHGVQPNSSTGVDTALPRLDDLLANCVEFVWNPDSKAQLLTSWNGSAHGAEQFRTLRSRLYRIRESQPLKALLITSALQAEGKSLVTTNLAKVLVRQRGCKVLMIDADMRAPRLREYFGAPTGPGLADYLQDGASESVAIQKSHEGELYLIQAGEHITHPAELISNGRFKKLLARAAAVFDWVLVDSPPILPVSDASVLAPMCDGVLMVVRAGVTPADASQKACQKLGDPRIVGVVLNGVEKSAGYGSYYEYGYGLHATKDPNK